MSLVLAAEDTGSSFNPVVIGIVVFVLIVLLVLFAIVFQFLGRYIRKRDVSGRKGQPV